MTPFFFRLKAPAKAIAGFAFFARYERLPVWLAWEAFGPGNGVDSLADLKWKPEFHSEKLDYKGWRRKKAILFKRPGLIFVEISNLLIFIKKRSQGQFYSGIYRCPPFGCR